jgi:hypothetical protein
MGIRGNYGHKNILIEVTHFGLSRFVQTCDLKKIICLRK